MVPEKQFAGCTPELFRRLGSNLEGSAPHPKWVVQVFLLLITPLPPPTGYLQPSLQCTHWLGFKPAAVLSGCRCLVPRARPGWQGSPRRCRDGRCQSAASAGSEMPRPSPGPRRMLGLMCTRKRRGIVRFLLGRADVRCATLVRLMATFQMICTVFILPPVKFNSLLLPVITTVLLTCESWCLLSQRMGEWRRSSWCGAKDGSALPFALLAQLPSDCTPWRGLSLKSHSSVTWVFMFN